MLNKIFALLLAAGIALSATVGAHALNAHASWDGMYICEINPKVCSKNRE